MNYNEMFIRAITKAMKEKKITGKMIEENTGVAQSSITNWKNGYQPKFDNALKVLQYLGINFSDIIDIPNDKLKYVMNNDAINVDEIEKFTGIPKKDIIDLKNGYINRFDYALIVLQFLYLDRLQIFDITGITEEDLRIFIAQNYSLYFFNEIRNIYAKLFSIYNSNIPNTDKLHEISNLMNYLSDYMNVNINKAIDKITGQDINSDVPLFFRDITSLNYDLSNYNVPFDRLPIESQPQ